MVRIQIDVDLSEFRPTTERAKRELRSRAKHLTRLLGYRLEALMKRSHRQGGTCPVVTGRLQSSIEPTFLKDLQVDVGPHTDYAEKVNKTYRFVEKAGDALKPEVDKLKDQAFKGWGE